MPPKGYRAKSCRHGHPYSGENLYVTPNGQQGCRQCRRQAGNTFSRKHPYRERDRKRQLRMSVIQAYGAQCVCCGEKEYAFLSIDHIGGKVSEGKRRKSDMLCSWLRAHSYPAGYRVLCHNCNQAIGYYGTCPHIEEVT